MKIRQREKVGIQLLAGSNHCSMAYCIPHQLEGICFSIAHTSEAAERPREAPILMRAPCVLLQHQRAAKITPGHQMHIYMHLNMVQHEYRPEWSNRQLESKLPSPAQPDSKHLSQAQSHPVSIPPFLCREGGHAT